MELYEIWNKIILKYFFSDRYDEEIFLSVEYSELIEYAIESEMLNEYIAKLNSKKEERGEKKVSNEIIVKNLFRQAFFGKAQPSLKLLLHLIEEKVKVQSENPQTMPLIALFMMPIANRPDLNSNNYYTKTTEFLTKNGFIGSNESLSCSSFASKGDALKKMWIQLEEWAKKRQFQYHLKVKFTNEKKTYVAPFLAEAVLTATQRMLFKRIFFKAGLVVGQDIPELKALKIMTDFGHIITYNDRNKFAKKLQDYKRTMIDAFYQAYNKWDGTTIVETKTVSDNGNEKYSFEDEGVVNRLYLSMSSSHGDYRFSIIANIHNSESYESFEYTGNFGDYEFCVDINGIAEEPKRSEQITTALSKEEEIVFTNKHCQNDKLRYVPSDIILLEQYFTNYISKVTVCKGGHYFVLVKNSQIGKYENWLAQNNAKPCKSHNLDKLYYLYDIESLQTEVTGTQSLRFPKQKKVSLVSTIVVGKEEDVKLLYEGLPAYFVIEGVSINSSIRAVFNSDGVIEEEPLQYIENLRVWKLSVIDDSKKTDKSFVIYEGTEQLSSTKYKFSKCSFPQEFKEISYNEFGEYQSNEDVFNGLNISNDCKINVNLKSLTENMQKNGSEPQFSNFDYASKDYILYALSTHQQVDKSYLDEAINTLLSNGLIEKIKSGLTNSLIDNYCRMGYINYAYINGKHTIAVNRPTLIWLPSVYAEKSIVSNQRNVHASLTTKICTEKYFKFLLTGARTPIFISKLIEKAKKANVIVQIDEHKSPFYPQRIVLWSEDIETISKFAINNDIQFEKCVYASSLLEKLSDVRLYFNHIIERESTKDFEGIKNSFLGYDYSATDYKSFKTHPQTFNKESSIITYFPDTYSRQTILWYNNHQYEIDLLWSYFVGMMLNNIVVAKYNNEENVITMPKHIKLPMLYARALTMISGDIPSYVDNYRQYKVSNNPYTNPVSGERILNKLGQTQK